MKANTTITAVDSNKIPMRANMLQCGFTNIICTVCDRSVRIGISLE